VWGREFSSNFFISFWRILIYSSSAFTVRCVQAKKGADESIEGKVGKMKKKEDWKT